MYGVSRQAAFLWMGSASGRPGEKTKTSVSCSSLLQLLTESHSTLGKCRECFYFQCPNFSGFRELLLSRKEVVRSSPPSPCGVTVQRWLSAHPSWCCFFGGNSFRKTIHWALAGQASRAVTTVWKGRWLCQAGCGPPMQALGVGKRVVSHYRPESRPTGSWDVEREGLGEELCWFNTDLLPCLCCQSHHGWTWAGSLSGEERA